MQENVLKIKKLREDAVTPSKAHIDDIGFDVTLTHIDSKNGETTFYGTGIAITPPKGFYADLVPRSSFSKTGYVIANSFGVIDPNYTGELKVGVLKIDKTKPDLILPGRYFQLILRPVISAKVVITDKLELTERSDGGFGSTGK